MRFIALLLLTAACWVPVSTRALERCDEGDFVDCCESADECQTYFGGDYPYCVQAGRQTGQCVECTVPEHCELDETCLEDDVRGSYCAPIAQD
ncbi:MAG: hypothetical protein ACI9MC_000808 [Kiritimatiellia bacterium]|jgi:hypothetical protein